MPTRPIAHPHRSHHTRGRRRPRAFAAGALAAAALLTACSGGSSATDGSSGFRGDTLARPVTLPALTLTADTGTPQTLTSLQAGHVLLVYFGYTHCPDVCPTTMADLASALRHSSPRVADKVRVAFVSSDPVRDTPAVLHQWLAKFDPPDSAYTGFTGSLSAIDAAANGVGVPLEPPVRQQDGTYQVDHGAQVLAFVNGSADHVWLAGTSPDDYAHDLALLANQETS